MNKKIIITAMVLVMTASISGTGIMLMNKKIVAQNYSPIISETTTVEQQHVIETTTAEQQHAIKEPKIYNDLKDEIYYKMLDSVDYLPSKVSGKMIYAVGNDSLRNIIDFQLNREKNESHSRICQEETNSPTVVNDLEWYSNGNEAYNINNLDKSFKAVSMGEEVDLYANTDERIIEIEGEKCYLYRARLFIPSGATDCLSPQEWAFNFLTDRNSWSVKDKEKYLGRECWHIIGDPEVKYYEKSGTSTFEFWVDIETGSLLKYNGLDSYGNIMEYMCVEDIKFGELNDNISFDYNKLSYYNKTN